MRTINSNINNDDNLLVNLGENYYYLKTIVRNRIEIAKLEFLDTISGLVSVLLAGILGIFFVMLIFTMLSGALIIYLASIFNSYIIAIFVVTGILVLFGVTLYILFKAKVKAALNRRLFELIEKNNENNDSR